MAGNVWEWCLNKYEDPNDIGIDRSGDRRVVRGGSWGSGPRLVRSSARLRLDPGARGNDCLGFRLAQDIE